MSKNNQLEEEVFDLDPHHCPIKPAIDIIGGKWKVIILYQLRGRVLRFGELKKGIPGITSKMLTQQLREMEQDRLVTRKVFAEVPPRVEYKATESADELGPILDMLCEWGMRRQAR